MASGDIAETSHLTCPIIPGYGLISNVFGLSSIAADRPGGIECVYNRGGFDASRANVICRYGTRTGE